MTTISPAWMIPALGLTWDRISQDMMETQYLDTGHMSDARVHTTDVYKQWCSCHGQECDVLFEFYD